MIVLNGDTPAYRVVCLSDLHTGHPMGLVPKDSPVASPDYTPQGRWQNTLREFYYDLVKRYAKPDMVICNGDALDGPGRKSAGMEQLTTDMAIQSDMAFDALEVWQPADGYRILSGSGYHVDGYGTWERTLADRLGATYNNEDYFYIEGTPIHVRHYIGVGANSGTQVGILGGDAIKMLLARETVKYPEAKVLIRSHVHTYTFAGTSKWLAMTLPSLQLPFTLYGSRLAPKAYDVGIVILDFDRNGGVAWHPELLDIKVTVPETDHYSRGRRRV